MGWCCCNKVCSVGNCARLLHLCLTLFVLYILLVTPSSELHQAWLLKSPKFFIIISLVVVSTICYLAASLLNPGYEPISQQDNQRDNLSRTKLKEATVRQQQQDIYDSSDSDNLMSTDAITGQWTCSSCRIDVQLRTKHCKMCQRCVRKFDHHCPWIGNCIGERNHRFFWLFLGLETVILAWGVHISWNSLLSSTSLIMWIRVNILTFSSLTVVFLGLLASIMLFLFHSYLMLTGQTTWEMASRLKISYLRELDPPINPFDEGPCRNICRFFCLVGGTNWNSVYNKTINNSNYSIYSGGTA